MPPPFLTSLSLSLSVIVPSMFLASKHYTERFLFWSVKFKGGLINWYILFYLKKKKLSRVNGTYIERYIYKNSIYENLNQAWRRVIPYVKMMSWQWWIVHYLVRIRMQTQTLLQLRTKKQFWLWKTFCRINSIGVWNSCWVSKQRNVNEKTKSGEESLLSFAHFSVCS